MRLVSNLLEKLAAGPAQLAHCSDDVVLRDN